MALREYSAIFLYFGIYFCIKQVYLFVFYLFLLYFCSELGYSVGVVWGIRYSFVGGMVYYFVFIVRFWLLFYGILDEKRGDIVCFIGNFY